MVAACRRNAPHAWESLVLRFERLIYTVARRGGLDADDAADVFQTAFMRLHEHLATLSQPERVQAWLVTTARRETLRRLRERRRSVPLGDSSSEAGAAADEPVDPEPLPEQLLEELQLRHRARTALDSMAEPCRSLLTLLYAAEEAPPYADIAARLGMPIGSIGPTRSRCLGKLREALG
ncbi:MAG: sigma-70 family RNA polymerase sigma factor [Nitrospira sp.]|nr:sigma-70 family RNA polymerase sigma factor [Nitrospira sp.]